MFENSNIEDVAQSSEPKLGDADTAEGQARRAEEAHFGEVRDESDNSPKGDFDQAVEEFEGWLDDQLEELKEDVEELPPLPTVEEEGLGGLRKAPKGQFEDCDLLEENDGDLIAFITGSDDL